MNSGREILLVETGYGFKEVIPALRQQFGVHLWLPKHARAFPTTSKRSWWYEYFRQRPRLTEYREQFLIVWNRIRQAPEFRDFFQYYGVDFFQVVHSRLRHLFVKVLPEAAVLQEQAVDFFDKHPKIAALFSVNFPFGNPWSYPLALAARARGIPVVTYQHSAFGYFDWPFSKYVDEVMSDYKLVWGKGAAAFMSGASRPIRDAQNSSCEPIPVGSLELQRIKRSLANSRIQRSRPTIVYPIASYNKNRFYFGHHRFTATEYYEMNRRVLAILAQASYAEVLIKLHPSQEENYQGLMDWVRACHHQHVHLSEDGSFADLLPRADLIIIDSPSTTLTQAVLTRARLLVYTGVYRLAPAAVAALQKRASVFRDFASFLNSLREIIESRHFDNAAFQNYEFANHYCTFQNDGHPAARMVDALADIATGERTVKVVRTESPRVQKFSFAGW